MGQQQLLLIILGVIVVGIAIAVGLSLFAANSVQANKDAIVNDINNLAANAYQFYIRPISMGGGGGAYDVSKGATAAYAVPFKMSCNDNASYVATPGAATCTIVGTNTINGTATGTVDNAGKLTFGAFTGNFQ